MQDRLAELECCCSFGNYSQKCLQCCPFGLGVCIGGTSASSFWAYSHEVSVAVEGVARIKTLQEWNE